MTLIYLFIQAFKRHGFLLETVPFLTGLDVAREEAQQLVPLRLATGERLRYRGHVQAVHSHAELVLR